MSNLGPISGKLQYEAQLLKKLNDALFMLEVDLLGKNSEFGISQKKVEESKKCLLEFVKRLYSLLKEETAYLIS